MRGRRCIAGYLFQLKLFTQNTNKKISFEASFTDRIYYGLKLLEVIFLHTDHLTPFFGFHEQNAGFSVNTVTNNSVKHFFFVWVLRQFFIFTLLFSIYYSKFKGKYQCSITEYRDSLFEGNIKWICRQQLLEYFCFNEDEECW